MIMMTDSLTYPVILTLSFPCMAIDMVKVVHSNLKPGSKGLINTVNFEKFINVTQIGTFIYIGRYGIPLVKRIRNRHECKHRLVW